MIVKRVTVSGEKVSVSTLVHEMGHVVDGELGGDWYWTMPRHKGEGWQSPEGRELLNALDRSEAIQELIQRGELARALGGAPVYRRPDAPASVPRTGTVPPRVFDYLLTPTEVFARAYAQWIALRQPDGGALMNDVRYSRGDIEAQKLGEEDLMVTADYLPVQWSDEDFQPIARAFDHLFSKRGLLNEHVR
jgi:hypothetical protein